MMTATHSNRSGVTQYLRRVDTPEAQNLARQGAELITVKVEVGHKKDLVDAFRGSHGVFLVTPIIVPPAAHEAELGKQQADAAVEAGVQHIIFSSLENVERITGGKKWVPHFTDKAKVEEYIRTLPVTGSFIYNALFLHQSPRIFPTSPGGRYVALPHLSA